MVPPKTGLRICITFELSSIAECLYTGFDVITNSTCLNVCLGIKEPFSKIPKGPFHTLVFFPKTSGGGI